jgi:hypothetical protein
MKVLGEQPAQRHPALLLDRSDKPDRPVRTPCYVCPSCFCTMNSCPFWLHRCCTSRQADCSQSRECSVKRHQHMPLNADLPPPKTSSPSCVLLLRKVVTKETNNRNTMMHQRCTTGQHTISWLIGQRWFGICHAMHLHYVLSADGCLPYILPMQLTLIIKGLHALPVQPMRRMPFLHCCRALVCDRTFSWGAASRATFHLVGLNDQSMHTTV